MSPVIERILSAERPWTDARRLGIFVTALLMADDASPLSRAAIRGIASGKLKVDSRVVEDLYRSGTRKERIVVAQSFAVSLLPARPFNRVFVDALASRPSARDRGRLIQALRFHLAWHPPAATRYSRLASRLLRSAKGDERLHALEIVARLDRVAQRDLMLVYRQLESTREDERINAIHALATWARRQSTSADVRRFATSDSVRAKIRAMRSRDLSTDVRAAAVQYNKGLSSGAPRLSSAVQAPAQGRARKNRRTDKRSRRSRS